MGTQPSSFLLLSGSLRASAMILWTTVANITAELGARSNLGAYDVDLERLRSLAVASAESASLLAKLAPYELMVRAIAEGEHDDDR